jgi:HTH-type transcriptional regulator/antitoxin HigA
VSAPVKGRAIRPLRTPEDHAAALEEVQVLMAADPAPSTPDGDRLEVLSVLVEAYENEHFPLLWPAAPAIDHDHSEGGHVD